MALRSILRRLTLSLIIVSWCATPPAARAEEGRDNREMMRLVRPLSLGVGESVVQVYSGDRLVSLGTIVADDGYVLTKRSELTGDPVTVRTYDGRRYPARVASVRRSNDLALLSVDSASFTYEPIEFTPFTPAVASFLISVGRSGRPIGLGVVGAPEQQIKHAGRLGVVLDADPMGRALVQGVFPDSGADIAGIEPGDLIVAVNGEREPTTQAVIRKLRGYFPGEIVRLTILRRPDKEQDASELAEMEMSAGIRDFTILRESENDSKVNGPRNARLSGFERVIQHDTVLDPDQCGGPVLDSSGRVVGLNIARAGRVVSYSLPSALVVSEIDGMLEQARVRSQAGSD